MLVIWYIIYLSCIGVLVFIWLFYIMYVIELPLSPCLCYLLIWLEPFSLSLMLDEFYVLIFPAYVELDFGLDMSYNGTRWFSFSYSIHMSSCHLFIRLYHLMWIWQDNISGSSLSLFYWCVLQPFCLVIC